MKKAILVFALFALFASCEKEEDVQPPKGLTFKYEIDFWGNPDNMKNDYAFITYWDGSINYHTDTIYWFTNVKHWEVEFVKDNPDYIPSFKNFGYTLTQNFDSIRARSWNNDTLYSEVFY